MPRLVFKKRQELICLLSKIKWAEGKETVGCWKWIVIYGPVDNFNLSSPSQATIFLDRHTEEDIIGFMYVHSSLNSYLGFEPTPFNDQFDIYKNWKECMTREGDKWTGKKEDRKV